jgi:DNA modification methylase
MKLELRYYSTMADKDFASDYPRNDDGLILFPRDEDYRKELFPFLVLSEHPAKANIFLVQSIVEYVSEPEEIVMDIMAGTGTIMTAALIGRRVICIEIEDEYVSILEKAAKSLESFAPGISEMITIIPGDSAKLLPLKIADHVIFSPPYSNIMRKKKLDKLSAEMVGNGLLKYSKHPDNIGNLNEFLYHQRMEIIYKATYNSLPAHGTLTIIIKDHIEKGERMFLGERAKKDCIRAGFELVGHHKWLPPGSAYTSFMRARGDTVVEDEDIIILRKPSDWAADNPVAAHRAVDYNITNKELVFA